MTLKEPTTLKVDIHDQINKDPIFEPIIKTLQNSPMKPVVPTSLIRHYNLGEDGLLQFNKEHICVPKGLIRTQILFDHHDAPIVGHQGIERTYEAIQRLFYWP